MDEKIVDKRLLFYGFEHFFTNRVLIKAIFLTKCKTDQCIYRWYVYSRPFINDNDKNYIWDYLQSDITELEFMIVYNRHKK